MDHRHNDISIRAKVACQIDPGYVQDQQREGQPAGQPLRRLPDDAAGRGIAGSGGLKTSDGLSRTMIQTNDLQKDSCQDWSLRISPLGWALLKGISGGSTALTNLENHKSYERWYEYRLRP